MPVAPATGVDGDEQWQNVQMSAVLTTGATGDHNGILSGESGPGTSMDPFTAGTSSTMGAHCFISTDSTAPSTFPGSGTSRSANAVTGELAHDSYSNGSFERTKSVTFAVGDANRTDWRCVGVGERNTGIGDEPYDNDTQGLIFIFDESQTKENTHTLTFKFKWTWAQTLTN